jgi:hypothetical protein
MAGDDGHVFDMIDAVNAQLPAPQQPSYAAGRVPSGVNVPVNVSSAVHDIPFGSGGVSPVVHAASERPKPMAQAPSLFMHRY